MLKSSYLISRSVFSLFDQDDLDPAYNIDGLKLHFHVMRRVY